MVKYSGEEVQEVYEVAFEYMSKDKYEVELEQCVSFKPNEDFDTPAACSSHASNIDTITVVSRCFI